jgi:hypothetical protein
MWFIFVTPADFHVGWRYTSFMYDARICLAFEFNIYVCFLSGVCVTGFFRPGLICCQFVYAHKRISTSNSLLWVLFRVNSVSYVGVQNERMVPEDIYLLSSDGFVLSRPLLKPYAHKAPKCTDCAPLFMKVLNWYFFSWLLPLTVICCRGFHLTWTLDCSRINLN